jgi:hypothetical protein
MADVAPLCEFANEGGRLHELVTESGVCRTCKATPSERRTLRRRRYTATVCTLKTTVDTLPEGAPVPIDSAAADRYRVEVVAMLTSGPNTGRTGPPRPTEHDAIEAFWDELEAERGRE